MFYGATLFMFSLHLLCWPVTSPDIKSASAIIYIFYTFLSLIPVWVPPTLHWPPLSLKRCFSVGPRPPPVPSAACPAPWSPGPSRSWWDGTRWTQSPSPPCTSRSPWLPLAAGSCSASPLTAGAPSLSAAPCSEPRTCSAPAALNQTWVGRRKMVSVLVNSLIRCWYKELIYKSAAPTSTCSWFNPVKPAQAWTTVFITYQYNVIFPGI